MFDDYPMTIVRYWHPRAKFAEINATDPATLRIYRSSDSSCLWKIMSMRMGFQMDQYIAQANELLQG